MSNPIFHFSVLKAVREHWTRCPKCGQVRWISACQRLQPVRCKKCGHVYLPEKV
ncbi:MAG: hypothetical protein QHH05_09835 [Syntrophomonadaceae bacterium]|nr:hypothetical protein [Syntrophomonadaceae bacterium]